MPFGARCLIGARIGPRDEGEPLFVVQLDDTKLPGLLRLLAWREPTSI